jgi:hypothetical protein
MLEISLQNQLDKYGNNLEIVLLPVGPGRLGRWYVQPLKNEDSSSV